MIFQTSKLEQPVPPNVKVQTVCYLPLNGMITFIRALLARNPKVPAMTASNLRTLALNGGVAYAEGSLVLARTLINEYANLINLNNLERLDRNVARTIIDASIAARQPGANLGSVTTVLASETNRAQLFLNQMNTVSTNVQNARDVWGGGYTSWNFATGLQTQSGLLAEIGVLSLSGGVTPSSYQPFINNTFISHEFTSD